ncbi:MAG: hypothetical protein A2268_06490 [Candidatus Raymondbacteria bacterium RifOxyA12_full_50_37]|nr:MAG: hypothetical protein A2268_06490 [Candidatus Raymondbacteria bacterium RifOxyA12_full_50_37]OGJ92662.1 MAG: hypothetical protein A2350_03935 [Candidatus Raymondbacteria bacterium RifOxyB12_full_50_8]OGJ94460.1 MAG: hypothetical protein A2248_15420 [Candidatus Raymondbacteria bacterium RIFOXYA2_FULL_49_16]OGJ99216.1 MAG: hypothetical protein A2453_07270 [Candidatus Raymondbacteria bacterium RIFOXYC2_FULL_50_21]OGK03539.1 MAG: hypothetical protein A2487_19880 [Candidatus Raymondbacteria b
MMNKILAPVVLCALLGLLAGCSNNPARPMDQADEYIFAWQALKIFYIFQSDLPSDPFTFDGPADLYASLDERWTKYYTPREANKLLSLFTTESSAGIGIFFDFEGDTLFIRHVIENSPAEDAGLRKGDTLLAADGISLVGISTDSLFSVLSGDSAQPITFTVLRGASHLEITVYRGYFVAPTVITDTLDDVAAHISLFEFLDSTTYPAGTEQELRVALAQTAAFPVTILNMRSNPGGLVDQCVKVANQFLANGDIIICSTMREYDQTLGTGATVDFIYRDTSAAGTGTRKFIILVDGYTASAAEVVTSAIKDNLASCRIMGSNTYGKARGQILMGTTAGGLVKITSMTFTTSHGIDYNLHGLAPHVQLNYDVDWIKAAQDSAHIMAGIPKRALKAPAHGPTRAQVIELNRKMRGIPRMERIAVVKK